MSKNRWTLAVVLKTQSDFWQQVNREETKKRKKAREKKSFPLNRPPPPPPRPLWRPSRFPVVVLSLRFSRPPTHPCFCSRGSEVHRAGSGGLIEIHTGEKRVRCALCMWGEHSKGSGRSNAGLRDPRVRWEKSSSKGFKRQIKCC